MTMMMLGVAIGFAPYAGYGWATFEVLSKDYGGPVRVQAAQKLANDPDPETREALVKATSNKNWKVRAAALEALAQRADPGLLDALMPHLSDRNQAVRCAGAAGIIRLSAARESEVQLSRAQSEGELTMIPQETIPPWARVFASEPRFCDEVRAAGVVVDLK